MRTWSAGEFGCGTHPSLAKQLTAPPIGRHIVRLFFGVSHEGTTKVVLSFKFLEPPPRGCPQNRWWCIPGTQPQVLKRKQKNADMLGPVGLRTKTGHPTLTSRVELEIVW